MSFANSRWPASKIAFDIIRIGSLVNHTCLVMLLAPNYGPNSFTLIRALTEQNPDIFLLLRSLSRVIAEMNFSVAMLQIRK